jgi:hypothetical protein
MTRFVSVLILLLVTILVRDVCSCPVEMREGDPALAKGLWGYRFSLGFTTPPCDGTVEKRINFYSLGIATSIETYNFGAFRSDWALDGSLLTGHANGIGFDWSGALRLTRPMRGYPIQLQPFARVGIGMGWLQIDGGHKLTNGFLFGLGASMAFSKAFALSYEYCYRIQRGVYTDTGVHLFTIDRFFESSKEAGTCDTLMLVLCALPATFALVFCSMALL